VTLHKTNGDATCPKLFDETCSVQNAANQTFLRVGSSRLFGYQMSETSSHETQDVVTNPNNRTWRSKSSRKSPVGDIALYNFGYHKNR